MSWSCLIHWVERNFRPGVSAIQLTFLCVCVRVCVRCFTSWSFIHASVLWVIWCHSHSILELWQGVIPPTTTITTTTPSPFGLFLSPGSLGGSARCIFPWSKPWLCMETELGGLQSRSHVVECFHQWIIFEWMPAFPPQAALNLCLYFLGFLWFFVCLFGERDRAVFSWRYHFS